MTDERLIRVSGLRFPEPVGKGLHRLADGSLKKTPLLGPRGGPSPPTGRGPDRRRG